MTAFSTVFLVGSKDNKTACDYLAEKTGLSRTRIKDAMKKGALWTKSQNGRAKRLRRATTIPRPGDVLSFYYDETILALKPPEARCIYKETHYSVWHKPPGLLVQGTKYADHCTLVRQAMMGLKTSQDLFVVHRIDREAEGLVVLAHSKQAAAKLSEMFKTRQVKKIYRIEVLGNPAETCPSGVIALDLDAREARSEFQVTDHDFEKNRSIVKVILQTGRLHQIRRHFAMIGHPVIGDPIYGLGNKNREGMRLAAIGLEFFCPYCRQPRVFETQPAAWPENLLQAPTANP